MANKKITNLTELLNADVLVDDVLVIAREGVETFKISVAELDLRYATSDTRYFGDPAVDGTWRHRVSGGLFLIEKRVLGVYVLKQELE